MRDAVSPLTRCDALRTQFLPDLLEHVAYLFLLRRAFPIRAPYHATFLTALLAAGLLGIGANLPCGKHSPRGKCETLRPCHRDDIPFKGPVKDRPVTLVDAERRLSVVFGILVRLGNHPGGSIRDALDARSNSVRSRDDA